eukprot:3334988-Rhodomonas_salina.2
MDGWVYRFEEQHKEEGGQDDEKEAEQASSWRRGRRRESCSVSSTLRFRQNACSSGMFHERGTGSGCDWRGRRERARAREHTTWTMYKAIYIY